MNDNREILCLSCEGFIFDFGGQISNIWLDIEQYMDRFLNIYPHYKKFYHTESIRMVRPTDKLLIMIFVPSLFSKTRSKKTTGMFLD